MNQEDGMKKKVSNLTCETAYFSARQDGAVVVFRPKGNQLAFSAMLEAKETVLAYFRTIEKDPEARIVLITFKEQKKRFEEYLSFFNMASSSRISEISVIRLFRAIDQFILKILSSDLFFISADCGRIIPMFAGISHACDYRILGDDAIFQNPALELGLIPKGGAARLLSQLIGKGKAFELILTQGDLTAHEAMKLGLADRCIPVADLESEALSIARQFTAIPAGTLGLAKKMINHPSPDFSEYLEFESLELLKTLHLSKSAFS